MGPGAVRVGLAGAVLVSHVSRLDVGVPAVLCFFILSGYWVVRLWDTHYRRLGVGAFALSRWLRIWLPFLGAALLALAADWLTGEPMPPGTLPSLAILGIGVHHVDPTGVAWSLDIELQFYALVPLLWLALRQPGAGRVAALALGSLALAALGWQLRQATGIRLLPLFLPPFVAGACLHALDLRPSGRAAALSAAVFVAVGGLVLSLDATRGLLLKGPDGLGAWDLPFQTAWALTLLPFLGWNVRQRSTPFDRHLGNFSYSLYLVHLPVIGLVATLALGGTMQGSGKIVAVAASILASVLFYGAVDRPAERLRVRLVARAARSPLRSHAVS